MKHSILKMGIAAVAILMAAVLHAKPVEINYTLEEHHEDCGGNEDFHVEYPVFKGELSVLNKSIKEALDITDEAVERRRRSRMLNLFLDYKRSYEALTKDESDDDIVSFYDSFEDFSSRTEIQEYEKAHAAETLKKMNRLKKILTKAEKYNPPESGYDEKGKKWLESSNAKKFADFFEKAWRGGKIPKIYHIYHYEDYVHSYIRMDGYRSDHGYNVLEINTTERALSIVFCKFSVGTMGRGWDNYDMLCLNFDLEAKKQVTFEDYIAEQNAYAEEHYAEALKEQGFASGFDFVKDFMKSWRGYEITESDAPYFTIVPRPSIFVSWFAYDDDTNRYICYPLDSWAVRLDTYTRLKLEHVSIIEL